MRRCPKTTIDANVWHKAFPRYLIVSMHQEGVCDAQWSSRIWNECERSLQKPNPGLSKQKVSTIYREMRKVLGRYQLLDNPYHKGEMDRMFGGLPGDVVPDAKDIHVMYLAVKTHSEYLVTYDMSDFTREASEDYGFDSVILDGFLCDMMDDDPSKFKAATVRTIASMKKKNETVEQIIQRLGRPESSEDGGYDCPE